MLRKFPSYISSPLIISPPPPWLPLITACRSNYGNLLFGRLEKTGQKRKRRKARRILRQLVPILTLCPAYLWKTRNK
jgi:hypothetical protein